MNYSEWLLNEFPELGDSSSLKRFNFVKKAKNETKYLRFMASLPTLLGTLLLGYGVGYIIGRFTNIDLWLVVIFSAALAFFISSKTQQKSDQLIVKKKLKELVYGELAYEIKN